MDLQPDVEERLVDPVALHAPADLLWSHRCQREALQPAAPVRPEELNTSVVSRQLRERGPQQAHEVRLLHGAGTEQLLDGGPQKH